MCACVYDDRFPYLAPKSGDDKNNSNNVSHTAHAHRRYDGAQQTNSRLPPLSAGRHLLGGGS